MELQKNEQSFPKKKAGVITIPNFKLYHKVIVIKTVCYQPKNRSVEQNQKHRNKPLHIIFDKGAKDTQRRKIVSSISGVQKIGYSHMKE